MTPERWQKINEVFQSAVDLKPDEQDAFLKEVCGDDESLRQQVKTLLAANDEAGNFINENAAKDAAHLLTLKSSPDLLGDKLCHYEIISVLGSGGMGKVYLARDSKLNRSVAVKTLPYSFSKESDYVKRFQTEAKAAANLNHPNVATVYSVEETDDHQTFITMEYIEGKPLNEMIPTGGLDVRTFLEWFIAITDALGHAHEKGIVHRDIKPGNIMITPSGIPKILDFGLARIDKAKISEHHSTLSLTKTGQILGTPTYMSPEQAKGKDADHRTDIFSLGVVMYEAVTGEKPFKGDNYASIVSNLLSREPKNISDLKPDVPFLLSRLIMKCLNKEPHFRYQSMDEVRVILREINSAIASGASLSKPEPFISTRSEKISTFFLYGLIGLLSLVSIFALWQWLSTDQAGEKGVAKFIIGHPQSSGLGVMNSKISPDGKNLLFQSYRNSGVRFYLRALDSFEAKPIAGTEGGHIGFFSPDGKWIAFTTISDNIKKVSIEGGSPVTVCESCPSDRTGFWGADNNIYFSSSKGLLRVSADGGGKPEQLTTINKEKGESEHYYPQLLPGGKNVLFTVGGSDGSKTGVLSLLDKKWNYIEEMGESGSGKYVSTGHIIFARGRQLMALAFDPETLEAADKPTLIQPDLFEMAPNIQISENGTLIYLAAISRTENQIVAVDRNGNVTPVLDRKGDFASPKYSPDGTRLTVTYNDDIWVYDIKTGTGNRITDEGKSEIPIWSLDGGSVIYATRDDDQYIIYEKNSDGTGEAREIYKSDKRVSPYSIHPTENVLALSVLNHQGNSGIIAKSLNDGTTKDVVSTRFREDTPRFSPDGKWLLYFSMDTGRPQIYARPWGREGEKIPVTKEGGMFPVWSPDGRELFYRNAGKIYLLSVNASQNFEVLSKTLLFEGKYLTSFDVSPDGQNLLMVKDEHGTLPTVVNVVLNWTEELKQKMNTSN